MAAAPGAAQAREADFRVPPPRAPAPADTTADALRDPDGHPFRAPAASPDETLLRVAVARAARDTATRLVALPDLAAELPFRIHRGGAGGWELSGSVAAGVFSRFDLERSDNELIEAHYRVGIRLRARHGGVAARWELRHVSSHLGDEHLVRTGRAPVSTSREEVELLLQASPARGALAYGGAGLVIRSSEGLERPSLHAGAEWRAGGGGRAEPYAAVDLYAWSELDWEPRVAAEAGLELGRRARLAITLGTGPSRAEQFFHEGETLVGVLFSYRR